ncbi:hypothetical protein ACFLX4_01045 [Chloroflexota bacterium]
MYMRYHPHYQYQVKAISFFGLIGAMAFFLSFFAFLSLVCIIVRAFRKHKIRVDPNNIDPNIRAGISTEELVEIERGNMEKIVLDETSMRYTMEQIEKWRKAKAMLDEYLSDIDKSKPKSNP